MKVTVTSLPVDEIITDLARQWKVKIKENGRELTIPIPNKIGEGFIRGTGFSSGIGVIEYKCVFFEDTEIIFNLKKTHPLKFIYSTKGKVEHSFEDDQKSRVINPFQNIIVSSSGFIGHVLRFKAEEMVQITSLEIIRATFNKVHDPFFEEMDSELQELFKDSSATKEFLYQGNYSIKTADIVEDINDRELIGFLNNLYVEGKLLEMLVQQIFQYNTEMKNNKSSRFLRRSDLEIVKKVKDLIHDNLEKNYSVDYMAKEVGTNINKLQEGFKFVFDLTVNKYAQKVKLDAAKELLEKSDYNISEIVHIIGLSSKSYFSKIFKERYGVSPKYFLRTRKDKIEDA